MKDLVLSSIDIDALADIVTERVTASLLPVLQNPGKYPRIVDETTLSLELGITRQTLSRWRKQKRIPFIQMGGVIRYDFNKVIEALESKRGGTR